MKRFLCAVALIFGMGLSSATLVGQDKPAPMKAPTLQPGGVNHDGLGVLLNKLGFNAQRIEDKVSVQFVAQLPRGNLNYSLNCYLTQNQDKVVLAVPLVALPEGDKLRADILEALLRKNADIGPAHFVCDPTNRQLILVRILDNRDLTTGQLRREIDKLGTIAGQTRSLWRPSEYPPLESK